MNNTHVLLSFTDLYTIKLIEDYNEIRNCIEFYVVIGWNSMNEPVIPIYTLLITEKYNMAYNLYEYINKNSSTVRNFDINQLLDWILSESVYQYIPF